MKKLEDEYVHVTEAAEMIGYTTAGVRKAIRENRLEAQKIGKMWFIKRKMLGAFKSPA